MTDKEILQGIELLEGAIPFDEVRNGDGWLDVHELFTEISQRIGAWHYPSKGEYPKDGEWVLVVAKNASVVPTPGKWVMQYFAKSDNYLRSDNYFANKTYSIYGPSVSCWQYIIPPKEEEA